MELKHLVGIYLGISLNPNKNSFLWLIAICALSLSEYFCTGFARERTVAEGRRKANGWFSLPLSWRRQTKRNYIKTNPNATTTYTQSAHTITLQINIISDWQECRRMMRKLNVTIYSWHSFKGAHKFKTLINS